jgi:hypothetical protein
LAKAKLAPAIPPTSNAQPAVFRGTGEAMACLGAITGVGSSYLKEAAAIDPSFLKQLRVMVDSGLGGALEVGGYETAVDQRK